MIKARSISSNILPVLFILVSGVVAALSSCAGAPRAAAAPQPSGTVVTAPASTTAVVALPGIWYSNRRYENYQIILLQDGTYINRGKSPSGDDFEDRGTWKVERDLLSARSAKGGERVWRIEHAEEGRLILKTVDVKEAMLGDLVEWDRISFRDLVGVWLDETGTTHYRLILTADMKYVLEGTPAAGAAFRDNGTWKLANQFFVARSGLKNEERIWDLTLGLDRRSMVIRNLVVKEGERGREMHLVKAD